MYYFYFRRKTGNTVMIYKILDKEEIGELKEELSCGLPGTAKVYISSWFVFWTLGIHFIHVQHRNNCSCRDKIYIFFWLCFSNLTRKPKRRGKNNKIYMLVWKACLNLLILLFKFHFSLYQCIVFVVINTFNKI